jgi:hypothetical protein
MKRLYGVLFTSGTYTFEGKYWAVYKNYDEYDKTLKGGRLQSKPGSTCLQSQTRTSCCLKAVARPRQPSRLGRGISSSW